MTGGESYGSSYSVEVLKPDGSAWCTLPDLSGKREWHTQSGLITCGGFLNDDNCITFSNGHWNISHKDVHTQVNHCAWTSSIHGTRLLGGYVIEHLKDNGVTPDSWSLEDYTS